LLDRRLAGAVATVVALAAAGAGCAHYPVTTPLTVAPGAPAAPPRYVFDQLAAADGDDDLFVCLTFSGGGTRAAAFAYGVLQKLRDTAIVRPKDGRPESLLDEVDCISSVSGGSFTAGYYALYGPRIFQDFRGRFLERDVEHELILKALNPLNWPRLLSPYYSRIDLATELYADTIFDNKTYADLLRAGHRPFIILNATDLTTGDDFAFTQDQFDLIGSDLGPFSIARAVAASSAFPFLLTPVSLVNHPEPPGYVPSQVLADAAEDYHVNRRRYLFGLHQSAYLDKKNNPYIHVMDGGLADNIGLRSLWRQVVDPTGFIGRRFNLARMSRLVLIAVNAHNQDPQTLNQHESPPGLKDVAFKTATVAIDNNSVETIESARDLGRELNQAQAIVARCKQIAHDPDHDCKPFAAPSEVRVHVIDVNLEAIPDPARRQRLLSIGTNYSLSHDDVELLIGAAAELLDRDPDFAKLLAALRAPPPPAPAPQSPPAPPSPPAPQ
jgi:predicted acylesterase/phospholipase RssA